MVEPIIDTHTHVVAVDTRRFPIDLVGVPGDSWVHDAPTTVEQLIALMDAADVAAAVLVQPVGAYGFDNRYVIEARRAAAGRLVGVGVVDAWAADAPERVGQLADRGITGLRLFAIEADRSTEKLAPDSVWRAAAEHALLVSTVVQPAGLAALDAELVRRPEVTVVLEHCAFVDATRSGSAAADQLMAMAERPNLVLKLTTNVLDLVDDAAELVVALAHRFGADRMMWGSDFSQTHDRSYAELVNVAREATAALAVDERRLVLADTARRLMPGLAG